MPRSQHPTNGKGTASAALSKGKSPTSRKRQLSPPAKSASTVSGEIRQSKRSRGPATGTSISIRSKTRASSKTNQKGVAPKIAPLRKSKYFLGGSEKTSDAQSVEEHDSLSDDETLDTAGAETSDYEDEDDSASLSAQLLASSEDEYFSEEEKPKKRGRTANRRAIGTPAVSKKKEQELWRQGVKAGLGPGHQVFIERPKARQEGSVKYSPDRIHPNTLEFLKELKGNNDREWLKMNDADYRSSKNDWDTFVEALTEKIIEKDDTIPELPPKDLTFRIYRDIRFSPDPTPYKTHFSAAWSRTGRKGPYAGYYVQIKPDGGSFVGSGLWMPEAASLSALRTAVDRRSHRLKRVLVDPDVRKEILGGISNDEKKVVTAFVKQNQENALKTKPKGYEADNANVELLRLRNYTMGKKLTDAEVLSPNALENISRLVGIMTPFVTYLNSIVMPDESSESSETEN